MMHSAHSHNSGAPALRRQVLHAANWIQYSDIAGNLPQKNQWTYSRFPIQSCQHYRPTGTVPRIDNRLHHVHVHPNLCFLLAVRTASEYAPKNWKPHYISDLLQLCCLYKMP